MPSTSLLEKSLKLLERGFDGGFRRFVIRGWVKGSMNFTLIKDDMVGMRGCIPVNLVSFFIN